MQMRASRRSKKSRVASASSQSSADSQPSSPQVPQGDSGSVSTSGESCSIEEKRRERRRRRKALAAANAAAAAGSANSDPATDNASLPPFHGFTREYVEERIRMNEADKQRERIRIQLLETEDLDDRQLKSVLGPSCKIS